MIDIVRDTWRAVLALVVGSILIESSRPAPPPVATSMAPVWQPAYPVAPQPAPPERPLRRVAAALTELGDSVIGVVR